ncbi:molybdate ABC transporter permease subunit [Devosia sp. XJ19-1]|uniref:Molybdenum transport system permease n=1 Tax=Devosia ureilytica TaxID=2952754 RepID=A0A9Q4FU89_9HYPH|nr:molybdate ABC transporter permease subunit [Devosia ureilytica]MCP8884799.1 molybdate ABC transporter permease subunit [Devosia ureilytica]MCP8888430.1 molybdate ABC transporter permease subunit [Devosia ureilytica]
MDIGPLLSPILLTLAMALCVTVILVVVATPIAWWLAQGRSRGREVIGALVTLPLVLPPTVLGFYLLLALGPSGPGGWLAGLSGARTLAFSFAGLVIGGAIASLPFMVQPLRNAFGAIETEVLEGAATLGASWLQRFWRIALPLARPGYLVGAIMSFAHTMGEFGVVLMIGGNIPGQTKVLSIAIYDFVERLEWDKAHVLAGGMVLLGFVVVFATLVVGRDRRIDH